MEHLGAYIVIGTSQSGKSSLINTIAKKSLARVGIEDGISVTKSFEIYEIDDSIFNSPIILIDIPGLHDNSLIPDGEISKILESAIVDCYSKEIHFKGFILIESIRSETMTILDCLARLSSVCGTESKRSVVVITNKIDLLQYIQDRYEGIEKMCSYEQLKCVPWTNKLETLNEAAKNRQINELKIALQGVIPFNSQFINKIKDEISQIAQGLADMQHIPTLTEIMIEAEKIAKDSPDITEDRVKTREEVVIKNSGGAMGKIAGRTREEKVILKEWYQEQVPKYSTVKEKLGYDKFLKIAEDLLKPKPKEYFMKKAALIKAEEIRSLFARD